MTRLTEAYLARTARGRKALGWASEAPERKPRRRSADKAPSMTGEQLKQCIADLARRCGWKVMAIRRARRGGNSEGWETPMQYDGKGWADLTLCHPERQLFIIRECKGEREALSFEQREWLAWLVRAGVDAAVARPRDWPALEALLMGRRDVT